MNESTINELQKIAQKVSIFQMATEDKNIILEGLRRAIMLSQIEDKSKGITSGKFDIFQFTGKNPKKAKSLFFACAYYANGFAYATDGTILAKVPMKYPNEFEGQYYQKDGTPIDFQGKTNYDSVIPYSRLEPGKGIELHIDHERIKQALASYNANNKLYGVKRIFLAKISVLDGINFYLNGAHLKQFANFVKEYPNCRFLFDSIEPRRRMIMLYDDESKATAIFMPYGSTYTREDMDNIPTFQL